MHSEKTNIVNENTKKCGGGTRQNLGTLTED